MSRRVFLLLILLLGVRLAAARPAVGDYLSSVRARVVEKVREALGRTAGEDEVAGVVTFASDGCFFVQEGEVGMKVLCAAPLPAPGERVVVLGAPSIEGGRIVFQARQWTGAGRGEIPPARPATMAELIDPESEGGVNGLRVTVEGRAVGFTEGGVAISVGNVPVNVMAEDLPDFLNDCDRTHPVVSVTGIAELMLDPSALLGKAGYVMGVKILVMRPDDVALRPDLRYLAACRDRRVEMLVLAVLAALAVGLFLLAFVIFRQQRRLFRTRTVMAERKRMADDIHDTIEQHLVGAGMLLKVNRLKEAQDVLVRAKREIRDIVWGLKNDDMMRLSPADMIRQIAHDENVKGLYRVDTRLEGLPEVLDAAAMRDLSLIVREAVGNAVKHGGAKRIALSADRCAGGGWRLRISNDGTPFDPETAPGAREGHFGLEGLRQRARRLGARVSFERRGAGMVLLLERGPA